VPPASSPPQPHRNHPGGREPPEAKVSQGGLTRSGYIPGRQGARVYFRTASIADSLARVVAAGGRQLYPETAVPGLGWVAEFEDSEGNCIALFTPLPDTAASDAARGAAGDRGA